MYLYDLLDANNYPLWLQNWRTRCPALSGRLSSSPLFTPLTGLATSITVNYKPNVEIFIGLATGDVIKFELDTDNQLKRVSTKPSDSHNIDCGGVKALSMHNDNLLIAWERCLIEQQGNEIGGSTQRTKFVQAGHSVKNH